MSKVQGFYDKLYCCSFLMMKALHLVASALVPWVEALTPLSEGFLVRL